MRTSHFPEKPFLLVFGLLSACASLTSSPELTRVDNILGNPSKLKEVSSIAPETTKEAQEFRSLAHKALADGEAEKSRHYADLAQLSFDTAEEEVRIHRAKLRIRKAAEEEAIALDSLKESDARRNEFERPVARMEKLVVLEEKDKVSSAQLKGLRADGDRLSRLERQRGLFDDALRVAPNGVKQDARGIVVTLREMFASGKNDILSERKKLLQKIAKLSQTYPEFSVVVEGHTDSHGSSNANLALSTSRAQAVVDYFAREAKIEFSRLKSVGFGEARPIADNSQAKGRATNRRVEVVFLSRN